MKQFIKKIWLPIGLALLAIICGTVVVSLFIANEGQRLNQLIRQMTKGTFAKSYEFNEKYQPLMEEAQKNPVLQPYIEKLELVVDKYHDKTAELFKQKNISRDERNKLVGELIKEGRATWDNFIEKAAEYPDLKIIIDKINAAESVKSSTTE